MFKASFGEDKVRNHFLQALLARRRKTIFPTVYPRYTSLNENFEYSYPLNDKSPPARKELR